MILRAMDSLDFVEAVMVLEEVLGIEIPEDDAGNPALAEGLDGTRRREQIGAIIRELFPD
jgi:acyl carrier protein